ncbi:phage holin family protein [Marinomonas sp. PE14-40]|uniref:phage holin family protein n=1 Tax=Marinomonas sp. PE14-40 TaxID=3060621 RepID=UPI003F6616CC
MKILPDELFEIALAMVVASIGGAVKYLIRIQQDPRKFSLIQLLITVFIGGFLGMITYFLGVSLGLDGGAIGFMSGVAGLMGNEAIRHYEQRFKRGGL